MLAIYNFIYPVLAVWSLVQDSKSCIVAPDAKLPLEYDEMPPPEELSGSTNVTFLLYTHIYTLAILGGVVFMIVPFVSNRIGGPRFLKVLQAILMFDCFSYMAWVTVYLPVSLIMNRDALSVCTGANDVTDADLQKYGPYFESSEYWFLVVHGSIIVLWLILFILRVIYVHTM